ncbi:MAG TPA: zf-TFIIB domain-containing protein [Geothrix sp.]|nr:zf-TFIIB domain-containing protein [Geothrix sp.]
MEAKTIRCAGCGASVPTDVPQCPYCAAQLATVACAACFALVPVSADHCPKCGAALAKRVAATPEGSACPACEKALVRERVGDLDVLACQGCGGLWLDRAMFEQLGASREQQGAVLGALPAPDAPATATMAEVRYRPCPSCHQRMNRVNYAKRSGVVLDVCKAHGIWFDQDELRRVLAFIAGGGLERARARELEDLNDAKRTAVPFPEHPSSSYEFSQQLPTSGAWLTAAGLVGLALNVAGLFLDRD